MDKSIVEIIPQSSTIGAEVRGLDLSVELSDQQYQQVNQAFLDYQIIYFRDQDLSSQQYNDIVEGEHPQ